MSGKRASLREHRTGRKAKVKGFVREDGKQKDRKVYSRKVKGTSTDVLQYER